MEKGKKRIIIGCILIALQLLSLLGSLSSGFEFNLSFNNFYIFLYDLIFLCTYFFVGIIGLILLISGLVARNKSTKNDSMINEKDNLVEEKKSEDDMNSVIDSAKESFESSELEIETTSSENEIIDNICKKCGNIISNEEKFCSCCGKKIKKQSKSKDSTEIKKVVKKIAVVTIIAILVLCVIGVIIASYTAYVDKQNSYDLATLSDSYGYYDEKVYAYQIEDSNGEKLSDILYLEDNYFIRVVIHGDVVYVSDKGVYEISESVLYTKSDEGEKREYLNWKGCLVEKYTYDGDVIPKKETFDLKVTKEYLDTNETVNFYSDGSYIISNETGEYKGIYKREGCIIDGVSENISGSRKWLVFNGEIKDRFYVRGSASHEVSQRAKYEFCKYLHDITGEYQFFIYSYEKEHPISTSK